jgi:hypothetical protein
MPSQGRSTPLQRATGEISTIDVKSGIFSFPYSLMLKGGMVTSHFAAIEVSSFPEISWCVPRKGVPGPRGIADPRGPLDLRDAPSIHGVPTTQGKVDLID